MNEYVPGNFGKREHYAIAASIDRYLGPLQSHVRR
jgi:hypothetical protein